jgi:hypothetical protein
MYRWSLVALLAQGPPTSCAGPSGTGEERIGDDLDSDADKPPEAVSRFEPLDVPALLPFWLGCLLAASVVGVLITISLGFPLATHQEYRGPLKPLPPAPRLETAPVRDRLRYDAAKQKEIKGTIEAAMRATARQGWGPPK